MCNLAEIRSEGSSALSISPSEPLLCCIIRAWKRSFHPQSCRDPSPRMPEKIFPFPARTCSSEISALCPKTLREPLGTGSGIALFSYKFTPRATEPSINTAGNQRFCSAAPPRPAEGTGDSNPQIPLPTNSFWERSAFPGLFNLEVYPLCLLLARAVFTSQSRHRLGLKSWSCSIRRDFAPWPIGNCL